MSAAEQRARQLPRKEHSSGDATIGWEMGGYECKAAMCHSIRARTNCRCIELVTCAVAWHGHRHGVCHIQAIARRLRGSLRFVADLASVIVEHACSNSWQCLILWCGTERQSIKYELFRPREAGQEPRSDSMYHLPHIPFELNPVAR